ncbi:response regulator [Mucilaginibacter mali]|uniref:histidine kinase n=1 Tax=Mucilaginibacter mali TaxID=2740462 RepID=A0A7D4Q1M0_9SPHI|nr:hybrid sensor histidine kinase/response regulator transcription factor [Mucilaginibacter mali]QKJ29027.1 response regulator [Mucilaginibacter mali]
MRSSLKYILLLLFVFPLFSNGQVTPVKFKHLTINEGLSQNTVYCTLQDSEGFIWIGTEDGLNRYDGYNFTIYKHKKSPITLSNSQVTCLFEDADKNLWVGTTDGINIYDRQKDQFKRIYTLSKKSSESNDFITTIVQDKAKSIWVSTYDGLKLYKPGSNSFKVFPINSPGLSKLTNKIQTMSLYNGKLWVGTGNDLKLFDTQKQAFISLPAIIDKNEELKHSGVRCIRKSRNDHYWIGTETAGLYDYDAQRNTLNNYRYKAGDANGMLSNIVRDVLVAADNEIWIGTREGLSILRAGDISNYTYDKYNPEALSHNSVRHFMKDRAGNIWVGTFAGGVDVYFAESKNFINISEQIGMKPGLSQRVISAIVKNADGSLWIGTEGGGLNYADLKHNVFQHYTISDLQNLNGSNIVKALSKDARGNLWVGTYNGLYYFDVANRKFASYPYLKKDSTPAISQFYALHATADGLCIGTNGAGLQFLDHKGVVISYLHSQKDPHSISSNNISALLYDKGNYWIGTQRGLNFFNAQTKQFTRYKYNDNDTTSLSSNTVISLFADAQNRLWIGTEGGGVNYFDRTHNKFYSIGEADGLANGVVHAINQDAQGNLWVSTNKGLSKIKFNTPAPPFSGHVKVTNYTIADGLPSNQFSNQSAITGQGNQLIFGSISGITLFDPARIITNTYKPPVVITDFLIRNKSVSVSDVDSPLQSQINETSEITLTHDQGFISFRFAALNYINPDNNSYAYKLEGFKGDNGWHYVGNQRMATYTNLDAGTYVFKVKASNNDGVWNNQVKSIKLIVLPPWWKTWWAYLTYVVIIGLLLYAFYYYSIKTATLTNELEFEYLSHQKDQELAQRKLTFFTNISHEIKTPLTLILAPLEKLIRLNESNNKVQNQLMLMQRNGERLIRLINQLLDFRRFEEGNMVLQAAEGNVVKFLNEVVISFEGYAQSKNISLMFKSAAPEIKVFYDRDKLEKIFYNLLSNALKFTPTNGRVAVNVRTDNNQLLVEVEDNGIGIPQENLTKIFDRFNHFSNPKQNAGGTGIGLSFSQGLAELHSGSISVESTVANGNEHGHTCFTVRLPLGSAHLRTNEIVNDFQDSENIEQYLTAAETVNLPVKTEAPAVTEQDEKPVMLIVEDNAEVLNFIANNFSADYVVHTAADGVEGLKLATELIPDMIISDVMMPNMNGITLCSKIKTDARTSHIPVILLTARTPLIFKLEGLETGADDYITKPFSIDILETRVRNLIESRKKLRDRYRKEISLQPQNVAITSPDEKFLAKVMAFIERNMAETTLSVEELGKEVGMSRVTLYRKIKALTNQTAIEFIRGVRIKRAAQLLEQNKFNVSEVAYMVGFIDVDYFRKCFKEQYGHTPKEYAHTADKNS